MSMAINSRRDVVEAYYSKLFCDPSCKDIEARVRDVVTEDWVCSPGAIGGEGAEGLAKTITFFETFAPDLRYTPQEIFEAEGDRIVVRSELSGTPVKPFMGVAATGKSFKVQAIDVHEFSSDGKIAKTYRVEDWARAISQLR